jgi:hypothetical protein
LTETFDKWIGKLSKVLLGQPGDFLWTLWLECLLDLPLHVGFALLDGLVLVDDLALGRRMVGRLVFFGAEAPGWRMGRMQEACGRLDAV